MPLEPVPGGGWRNRSGPRRKSAIPVAPAKPVEEWGRLIRAANDRAFDARSPNPLGPTRTPDRERWTLISTCRAAYEDGWDYAALERASGMKQRHIRRWANADI